jgi:nitrate reductase NapAB chaperone NapD
MRTLWGVYLSVIAIWVGRIVFVVMGVAWELSTDSPLWIRTLNGVLASIVVSVVFSKILESLCASQNTAQQSAMPSASR